MLTNGTMSIFESVKESNQTWMHRLVDFPTWWLRSLCTSWILPVWADPWTGQFRQTNRQKDDLLHSLSLLLCYAWAKQSPQLQAIAASHADHASRIFCCKSIPQILYQYQQQHIRVFLVFLVPRKHKSMQSYARSTLMTSVAAVFKFPEQLEGSESCCPAPYQRHPGLP